MNERLFWDKIDELRKRIEQIDPTYKDLPEEVLERIRDFPSRREVGEGEDLELEDLVAVHVTDTFPEGGTIRTRFSYDPEILRDTIHFSLNHPVEGHMYGSWDDRKYAILVPLERLRGRLQNFNPVDTFILGDLDLPEGSVVMGKFEDLEDKLMDCLPPFIVRHIKLNPKKYVGKTVGRAGKADIILADYSKPGENLNGFRKAVYDQIIRMGYLPMLGGMWNWAGWWPTHYADLMKREGLQHIPHNCHWAEALEDITLRIKLAKDLGAQDELKLAIEDAKEFVRGEGLAELYRDQQIPQKYLDILNDIAAKASAYLDESL